MAGLPPKTFFFFTVDFPSRPIGLVKVPSEASPLLGLYFSSIYFAQTYLFQLDTIPPPLIFFCRVQGTNVFISSPLSSYSTVVLRSKVSLFPFNPRPPELLKASLAMIGGIRSLLFLNLSFFLSPVANFFHP